MRRRLFLMQNLLAMMFVAGMIVVSPLIAAEKPNVVIFYADDLGWGECGCYGCKDIPTPNIDSLAANGVRFTSGYVAATYCSPSRAGLMTGRYPTRFGHEFNSVASKTSGLSLNETTMADRLKTLGYTTICIGKWHLGAGLDHRPTKRGFDEFFGTLGNTPFFHPTQFVDSRESTEIKEITSDDFYTTDAYADRAVDWIEKNKDKSTFLYLPFNAQHAPLQAPQKYLDRFPDIKDQNRKLFAAMMSGMDDAIGRVVGKYRELGLESNTLFFFIADNGGPTRSTTSQNGGLRGFKMTTFEGGPRVPFIAQWKGRYPAGVTYDSPVLNLDVLPTAIAAAGGKIDPAWKLDGVDLTPYLTGANQEKPHETIFWRYSPQWAVRHGDMKLVVANGGGGQPELYDLAKDLGESRNLAASQPETVEKLQKLYDAWNSQQIESTVPPNEDNLKGKKNGNKKVNNKKAAK
ncbi:MAG: sulfatase-like hydrolase/transferase [Planctomycetota bacterium]